MKIRLRKSSPTHHDLTIDRNDGSSEQMKCETKSFLDHDLIHYAVEREAELSAGFWGTVASGTAIAELNDVSFTPATKTQLMIAEALVGVMTGILKQTDVSNAAITARDYLEQTSPGASLFMTQTFVDNVVQRMRHLRGEWNATRFGNTFEIEWPE